MSSTDDSALSSNPDDKSKGFFYPPFSGGGGTGTSSGAAILVDDTLRLPKDGSQPMTGALTSTRITTTYAPLVNEDAVNKAYYDANILPVFATVLTNTMIGNLTMTPPATITATAAPTSGDHLANKTYADGALDNPLLNKSGTQGMLGNLSMGGFSMTNVADPIAGTDAINNLFLTNSATAYDAVLKAGSTVTGAITFGGVAEISTTAVSSLGAPMDNTDASTKLYVTSEIAATPPLLLTGGAISGNLATNSSITANGGNLGMNANKITSLLGGVALTDLANTGQAAAAVTPPATFLPLAGGSMSGNLLLVAPSILTTNGIGSATPGTASSLFEPNATQLTIGSASTTTISAQAATIDICPASAIAINVSTAAASAATVAIGGAGVGSTVTIGNDATVINIDGSTNAINDASGNVAIANLALHTGAVSIGSDGSTPINIGGQGGITIGVSNVVATVSVDAAATTIGRAAITHIRGGVANIGTSATGSIVNVAVSGATGGSVSIGDSNATSINGTTIAVGENLASVVSVASATSHTGAVSIGTTGANTTVTTVASATINIGTATVGTLVNIGSDLGHTGAVTIGPQGGGSSATTVGGSAVSIANANPAATVAINGGAAASGNVTIVGGATPSAILQCGGGTIEIGVDPLASVVTKHIGSSSSWTEQFPSGAILGLAAVVRSPELGLFVAIGDGPPAAYAKSPDGVTWTSAATLPGGAIGRTAICWSGELSLFVVVSSQLTMPVTISSDAITWTTVASTSAIAWVDVCWSPQLLLFVAVSSANSVGNVMRSANGTVWTTQNLAVSGQLWKKVIWVAQLMLFVATTTTTPSTSPDGIIWTTRTSASTNHSGLAWSPLLRLLVATNNTNATITTSSDGITWTTFTSSRSTGFDTPLIWAPALRAFVSGKGTKYFYSVDGFAWSASTHSALVSPWPAVAASSTGTVVFMNAEKVATGVLAAAPDFTTSVALLTPAANFGSVDGEDITIDGTATLSATSAGGAVDVDGELSTNIANDANHCGPVSMGRIGSGGTATIEGTSILFGSGALNNTNSASQATFALDATKWEAAIPIGIPTAVLACVRGDLGIIAMCSTGTAVTSAFISTNGGYTWSQAGTGLAVTRTWEEVIYSETASAYVAVSSNGASATAVYSSVNGTTWTANTMGAGNAFSGVCYGGGYFIAIARGQSEIRWTTNVPGTWTAVAAQLGTVLNWEDIVYAPEIDRFVAIASTGTTLQKIRYSTGNPVLVAPWTAPSSVGADLAWTSIAWSPTLLMFVAVPGAASTQIIISTDGAVTWTAVSQGVSTAWESIKWIDDLEVFVATRLNTNSFMYSSNGTSWTHVTVPTGSGTGRMFPVWNPRANPRAITMIQGTNSISNIPQVLLTTASRTVTVGTRGTSNVAIGATNVVMRGPVAPFTSAAPFFFATVSSDATAYAVNTPFLFNSNILTNGYAYNGNTGPGYNATTVFSNAVFPGNLQGAYYVPITGIYRITGSHLLLLQAGTPTLVLAINGALYADAYSVRTLNVATTRQNVKFEFVVRICLGSYFQLICTDVGFDRTIANAGRSSILIEFIGN